MPANDIKIIQQLDEVRALAKLRHPNIVSYNAAWIESSSCNSSVPSTDRKSYRSHTSKHHRKESKSCNSVLIEDLFSDKNGLNNNNIKICHNEPNVLDTKIPSTTDMYTDIRTKKRNKIYENVNGIISKRFEELDSSVEIIEERIIEKSNKEKYTEDSSVDIIFVNSKSNESRVSITETDISSSSYEESYSREVCTYTTNDKVSRLY